MKRAWVAVALLAGSWLPGLGIFHQPDPVAPWAWGVLVAAGVLLLVGVIEELPGRAALAVTLVLALPGVWLLPWPHALVPALLAGGAALALVGPAVPAILRGKASRAGREHVGAAGTTPAGTAGPTWLASVAGASFAAAGILLAQGLALEVYAHVTGRSHELPAPLPQLLAGVARLLGLNVSATGSNLPLDSMRLVHQLGATWELLLDPATLSFLVGGVVLLALRAWASAPAGARFRAVARPLAVLVLGVAVWLPLRAALLMALYMHRALCTDYDAPLALMDQFWNSWLLIGLLAVPVGVMWRFASRRIYLAERVGPSGLVEAPADATGTVAPSPARLAVAIALAFLAVFLLTAGLLWDPPGQRKGGRVGIDEYHSRWEPTDQPFDTTRYGYNNAYDYYVIYDYSTRFYEMSRLTAPLSDQSLRDLDVLVIKVPGGDRARPPHYTPDEVEAVRRFVARGGGVFLLGEHTDVFGVGRSLNQIARPFGFEFRYDCVFGIDTGFMQRYRPDAVLHPIVQHLPELDFAVSCSIAPGASRGQAVILQPALKNLPAEYHVSNYYPQLENRPDMRYGWSVQLWATRYGQGRVAAFTDSTQFSNFCVFDPGKAELWLGMIEWLNHRDSGLRHAPAGLLVVGGLAMAAALVLARRGRGAWVALVAAGLLGSGVTGAAVGAAQRWAVPPAPQVRPMVRCVMDRSLSAGVLPIDGFTAGEPNGFGLFERWILRLGYFTQRRSGDGVFDGEVVVYTNPTRPVSAEYRAKLRRYVEAGGKVLVLDSHDNTHSTANQLLAPFGMSARPLLAPATQGGLPPPPASARVSVEGDLTMPPLWSALAGIHVTGACEVAGGEPLLRLHDHPVAAFQQVGNGMVLVLGVGSRFSDQNMGVTGDVEPTADLMKVYSLEFALLRALVEGGKTTAQTQPQPLTHPQTQPSER